jgi:hypothetical protein
MLFFLEKIRKVDLAKVGNFVEIIFKIASIFAIVVGAFWAKHQFDITRIPFSNLEVSVIAESKSYSDSLRLLFINIKSRNIGKVLVIPDSIIATVHKIPVKNELGILDVDKQPVIYSTNVLKRYPDGCELEPGVEFNDNLILIVPKDSIYSVQATLNYDRNYEVDNSTVIQAR